MGKYVYARENIRTIKLIGLLLGIPMILFSVFLIIELGWLGYGTLFADVIFFIILAVFAANASKWRKWHRKIESNGSRLSGKVIEFKAESVGEEMSYTKYWLVVEYFDHFGEARTFATPALSFPPSERKDVICDVYIYGDEILATNFQNLYKK